jgi:hypothetical protein
MMSDADDDDEHDGGMDASEAAGTLSQTRSRRVSGAERSDGVNVPPSLSRRNSRRVMRRISIPVMGSASRRYSSNLGQSFGSAGGH